jgi:TP901 family phage tail tape measure protein
VSNATSKQYGELESAALSMAAKTQFTAKQVADGMGFLAMAGMDATKIVKAMPQALQLASAGMIDVADASNIVTNVMAGMGLEMEDLARANDTIVSAITGSNVDVRMLGEAFKYVGPVAKSAGISFEEITAALGKLGNAGIQGSMAGTTLRAAISRLLAPSEAATKMLDQFGVQILNADGSMKSLEEIIGAIEFSGLSEGAAGASRMMEIFGLRAGPGMQALVSQGSHSLGVFKARLEGAAGTAERISRMQLGTLSGRFKILQSAIAGLAIDMGQRLLPVAKKIVDSFTKVVNWFNSWSDTMKNAVIAIPVLTTLVLGLVAAMKGLVAVFKSKAFLMTLKSFGAMAIPLIVVVAAISSVVTAIGAISIAWKREGENIKAEIRNIATYFRGLWSSIAFEAGQVFHQIVKILGAAMKKINAFLDPFKEKIIIAMSIVAGKTPAEAGAIVQATVGEKAIDLEKTLKALKAEVKIIFKGILGIADTASTYLEEVLETGADAAKTVAKDLKEGFTEGTKILDLKSRIEQLTTAFGLVGKGGAPGGVAETAETIATTLEEGSTSIANSTKKVSEQQEKTAEEIAQDAENTRNSIRQTGLSMLTSMGEAGGVIGAAAEGFKEGGPWAALFAALGELMKKTASFASMTQSLNYVMRSLLPILNQLLRPIAQSFVAFGVLVDVFMSLAMNVTGLGIVTEKSMQVLELVMKGFMKSMEGVVWVFNWVFRQIADLLDKLKMTGTAKKVRSMQIVWTDVLGRMSDAYKDSTEKVNGMGSAAAAAAEALHNIPEGYKVALEQFRATEAETGAGVAGGVNLGEHFLGSAGLSAELRAGGVVVNVEGSGDPIAVAEEVVRIIDERESDITGTLGPLESTYAVDPGI